jgi:hypothetical protein
MTGVDELNGELKRIKKIIYHKKTSLCEARSKPMTVKKYVKGVIMKLYVNVKGVLMNFYVSVIRLILMFTVS